MVVTKEQDYFIENRTENKIETKAKTIPFKLPSNILKLNIKTTAELNGRNSLAGRLGHDYMIRPN